MNIRTKTTAAIGFLLLCTLAGYGQNMRIVPFDCDNLAFLSIARMPAREIWTKQTLSIGAYRPLAHFTLAVQHAFSGMNTPPYFAVNLLLLFLCGVMLFFIMRRLEAPVFAAAFTAALFILDVRCRNSQLYIGARQTTMVVFFGAAAILLMLYYTHGGKGEGAKWSVPAILFAVPALAFASLLSKEAGVAFFPALVLIYTGSKSPIRNKIIFFAIMAGLAALFIVLWKHFTNPGYGIMDYGESAGYFTEKYQRLTDLAFGKRIAVFSYSVVALAVGTFLPYIFDPVGRIEPYFLTHPVYIAWMASSVFISVFAVRAALRDRRAGLYFLSVVAAGALVHFLSFRYRNMVPGAAALAVLAGVGMKDLFDAPKFKKYIAAALVALVLLTCAASAGMMFRHVERNRRINPRKCLVRTDVSHQVVEMIKHKYGQNTKEKRQ